MKNCDFKYLKWLNEIANALIRKYKKNEDVIAQN